MKWNDLFEGFAIWHGAIIMLFGVAWMLSTFFKSPAYAASIAIAKTVGVGIIVNMCGEALQWPRGWPPTVFWAVTTVIGLVSFTAGTAYYMRRVEP
jgi:ABC-type glycerol-3-phosphate transport system permease component